MEIFCLEDFKVEYEKLISKKPYQTLEEEIISYFFNKTSQELLSGIRLNNSDTVPYIKKRLLGRGGYRCYFLIVLKEEHLYLMFVHPKRGPDGAENIKDKSKAYLLKKVHDCIKSEELYIVALDTSKSKIVFKKKDKRA